MELKYKQVKFHAHDRWFGESVLIGAKIIGFCFRISLVIGTILGAGYGAGKLLE